MVIIVKIKRCSDGFRSGYLRKALDYLSDKEKAKHIGGYAVNPYNVDETYAQMCYVKEYFHKTQDNPLIHFIISFDKDVKTYEKAKSHAILIGAYFKCRYQLLWAVHQKQRGESMYHVHMILNATSFVDGKLFDSYKTENIEAFCEHIQNVTGSACRYYYAGTRSSDEA